MKLYKIETPIKCDIETCDNTNAVLIVRAEGQGDYAVCPDCVEAMSDMNSDNAEFFAQTPLPGRVQS